MPLQTPVHFLLALTVAGLLPAASITFNPAPTLDTGWNNCANYAGYSCRTTAYFNGGTLFDSDDTNISPLFLSAFNAWNASGGGQGWTLSNGGALGGSYDVTIARALQFNAGGNVANNNVVLGGEEINVNVGNLTKPVPGAGEQLVWVQGLFDNYLLNGTIVPGFFEMDIASGACGGATFCPPAYPFQYLDDHFYDRPRATYQPPGATQAFFDANAYLAIRNPTLKTLAVYDGLSYGFQNFISPEPGTWLLLFGGLLLVVVARHRLALRA